jgi:hypothetical protein
MAGKAFKLTLNTEDIIKAVKEEQDLAFFVGGSLVADAVEARARPISQRVADRVFVVTRTHAKGKPYKKYAELVGRRGGVVVGSSSPLAHLLELGTKPHGGHPGTAAKPFIRPALDESKEMAEKAIGDALQTQLEKRLK